MASPDTKHKKYAAHIKKVKKVRAFVEGKEKVAEYIHALPGQEPNDDDLKIYRQRTYYLPAMGRTIDAFTGMVMSNGAKASEMPETHKDLLNDITNDGEPLGRFAGVLVREVITASRGFVLADYPAREDAVEMTIAQAEAAGLRPYARFYKSEDIIDWRVTVKDGVRILSHIRLLERYEVPGADEWETTEAVQIRVLDIDPVANCYRVRIYRQAEKGSTWGLYGQPRWPEMNRQKIPYIPGYIVGPSSLDADNLEDPPLYDMADISEAHLNNSAGSEWALMWCGCPTLVIAGTVPKGADGNPLPIKIGSSSAIILGEGGSAELLQASADAVGALKSAMDDKRRDMAAIGARILIDSGSSNISTETAKLERVGEHSVLSEISNTCASALTGIVRILLEWSGVADTIADKVTVSLNTDFVPKGMQSGELSEWIKGVQSGLVPLTILFNRLKSRGEVPEEMTEEQYREALVQDADELGLNEPDPNDPNDPNEQDPNANPDDQNNDQPE